MKQVVIAARRPRRGARTAESREDGGARQRKDLEIRTRCRIGRAGATSLMVVDASVWMAVFPTHDPHHGASRSFLDSAVTVQRDLHLPDIALVEIAGVFSRHTGSTRLAARTVRAALEHTTGASRRAMRTNELNGGHREILRGVYPRAKRRTQDDTGDGLHFATDAKA